MKDMESSKAYLKIDWYDQPQPAQPAQSGQSGQVKTIQIHWMVFFYVLEEKTIEHFFPKKYLAIEKFAMD